MKKLVLKLLQGCGLFILARNNSAHMARILMYHNFQSDDNRTPDAVTVIALRTQLEYLRRHFQVLPLTALIEQIRSGGPLTRCSVALTIDDGRRNFYELFFPLLREFQMPATLFVVSSFIGGHDWLWTDKVLWLAEHSQSPHELRPGRIDRLFATLNRLKPETRNSLIASLANQMRVSIPKQPPSRYAPCSWSELRLMADSGLVEIGSHTVTHPILSSISDEESWCELNESRSQIQKGLGRQIQLFCFPNGKSRDYRSSHLRQLKEAGYSGAVVARFGAAHKDSSVYELPRMGVSGDTDMLSFSKYLDGVEHYQTNILRLFRPSHDD